MYIMFKNFHSSSDLSILYTGLSTHTFFYEGKYDGKFYSQKSLFAYLNFLMLCQQADVTNAFELHMVKHEAYFKGRSHMMSNLKISFNVMAHLILGLTWSF